MTMDDAESALTPLGFTPTEAAVYVQLWRGGDQTAYAVAKALGKPAPQVYAAMDSLKQKGAALSGGAEPRVWAALAPAVLLRKLESEFTEQRARAEDLLSNLGVSSWAGEVYRLTTSEQVLARVREMLTCATSSVLLDCFPAPLSVLREDIEATAQRGIAVGVIVYTIDVRLAGARSVRSSLAEAVLRDVPGEILQCSVDGAHYVAALFEPAGRLRTGFWTENPLMAGLAHNGLATEFGYTQLTALADAGASAAQLRSVRDEMAVLLWRATPGFRQLRE
jgi:sugar-specific transcriptional regulator TrmB